MSVSLTSIRASRSADSLHLVAEAGIEGEEALVALCRGKRKTINQLKTIGVRTTRDLCFLVPSDIMLLNIMDLVARRRLLNFLSRFKDTLLEKKDVKSLAALCQYDTKLTNELERVGIKTLADLRNPLVLKEGTLNKLHTTPVKYRRLLLAACFGKTAHSKDRTDPDVTRLFKLDVNTKQCSVDSAADVDCNRIGLHKRMQLGLYSRRKSGSFTLPRSIEDSTMLKSPPVTDRDLPATPSPSDRKKKRAARSKSLSRAVNLSKMEAESSASRSNPDRASADGHSLTMSESLSQLADIENCSDDEQEDLTPSRRSSSRLAIAVSNIETRSVSSGTKLAHSTHAERRSVVTAVRVKPLWAHVTNAKLSLRKRVTVLSQIGSIINEHHDSTRVDLSLQGWWRDHYDVFSSLAELIRAMRLEALPAMPSRELCYTPKQNGANVQHPDRIAVLLAETCATLIVLTKHGGSYHGFGARAAEFVPLLIRRLNCPDEEVSNALMSTLEQMVLYLPDHHQLMAKALVKYSLKGAGLVRCCCLDLLTTVLIQGFESTDLEVCMPSVAGLVAKGCHDDQRDVRFSARKLFLAFEARWPYSARRVYSSLNPSVKVVLNKEREQLYRIIPDLGNHSPGR